MISIFLGSFNGNFPPYISLANLNYNLKQVKSNVAWLKLIVWIMNIGCFIQLILVKSIKTLLRNIMPNNLLLLVGFKDSQRWMHSLSILLIIHFYFESSTKRITLKLFCDNRFSTFVGFTSLPVIYLLFLFYLMRKQILFGVSINFGLQLFISNSFTNFQLLFTIKYK